MRPSGGSRLSAMSAIHARSLRKTYSLGGSNSVEALRGVDLAVDPGRFIALIGRSGSGKSTLLNLIGGLDHATSGELTVGGHDLVGLEPKGLAAFRAGVVGFVFQSFHLQPRFPAWENVALPLIFTGVPRKERRSRALALLERVGLGHRADHSPSELSGGEQQRVAFARSLVSSPQLLLADEPTGNLDSRTSEEIMVLLEEARQADTTIIMVTHDEALATKHADEVLRMADGQLVDATTGAAT